jgi:hypothetical protein
MCGLFLEQRRGVWDAADSPYGVGRVGAAHLIVALLWEVPQGY